jgi:spermidine/putrescine-binding protein
MPRLTRLIPIALLIALASGCGGGGGAEQASGGVTLRYGLWDPNQEPVYQKCADRFEQANPGIDVKLEVNNWGDYWSSLARGFVAETAPDVFTDHLSKYPQFVESEVIEPVNARQADMGAYLPGLADLWRTPSGKQYGFPKDWDTVAIVVNEDMLRDAGVTKAELDRATWNPTDGERSSASPRDSASTGTACAATSRASTRATSQRTGWASTPTDSRTARLPGPASRAASASNCSTRTPRARTTTTTTRASSRPWPGGGG